MSSSADVSHVVQSRKIQRLSDDVVKKINAGEAITRPVSAVKELIENSLDADATRIVVKVKDGGKSMIQVIDNGKGIHKDDLDILCKPHTTSKLSKYEDLLDMQTYGFRGEALSSISVASDLNVITKTEDSLVAYKISYKNGEPTSVPKPLAGTTGTVITLENIFASLPTKQKSLKSAAEEYNLIAALITKYAIHTSSRVSFTCFRDGESNPDVYSPAGNQTLENIRLFYGKDVAGSLLPVSAISSKGIFEMTGLVSGLNHGVKRSTFILFINNRLVDCNALRKSIETLYFNHMAKSIMYFVYLSLKVDPKIMDVNYHPAKQEVRFLYEEHIFAEVTQCIQDKLSSSSRTEFKSPKAQLANKTNHSAKSPKKTTGKSNQNVRASDKIRTDHCSQSLDDLWIRKRIDIETGKNSHRREIELTSVLSLREECSKNCDENLRELLKKSCYVGCVNKEIMIISHELKLLSVHLPSFNRELFYNLYLRDFGNFGLIRLDTPHNIDDLITLYYKATKGDHFDEAKRKNCRNLRSSRIQAMLDDYFSICIDENGLLKTLPLIIKGYLPSLINLPDFIHDLERKVDWLSEKKCFLSVGRAIARFYGSSVPDTEDWPKIIKSVVYPMMKANLLTPYSLNASVQELTRTSELYKVFERC